MSVSYLRDNKLLMELALDMQIISMIYRKFSSSNYVRTKMQKNSCMQKSTVIVS